MALAYITAENNYLKPATDESFAQAFVREVHNDLNDVKHSFIKIGFRLNEANELKYYKELGYESIVELAEKEFGFKKTTTYALMKVHELFHDPQQPMRISEKYDKYSHSQLIELSRAKYVGTAFWEIVKPTDSVDKLKKFVSEWNAEYVDGCGYIPNLKTVDEYLDAYAARRASKQRYLEQLDGQTEMDLDDEKFSAYAENSESETDNFSAYAEKIVPRAEEEPPQAAPLSDTEIITLVLKRGTGVKNGKFRIVEYHSTCDTQTNFVKFVRTEYGRSYFSFSNELFDKIETDADRLTIYRSRGGKIVLTWSVVAGRISRLITAGEYLSESEESEYRAWKAERDGEAVEDNLSAFAENSETQADSFSTEMEKSEKPRRTNREYLAKLTDEKLASELCLKIIGIFPLHGKSTQFMSAVQPKLIEWLSAERAEVKQ